VVHFHAKLQQRRVEISSMLNRNILLRATIWIVVPILFATFLGGENITRELDTLVFGFRAIGSLLNSHSSQAKLTDFTNEFNRFIRRKCERGCHPVHNTEEFEWMRELRGQYIVMQEEYEDFLQRGHKFPYFHEYKHYTDPGDDDYSKERTRSNISSVWNAIWLKAWGKETEMGRRFFPRTMAAIRKTPLSTAMLSLLQPRHGVRWHEGYFNGILRYHVGIQIPAGGKDGRGMRGGSKSREEFRNNNTNNEDRPILPRKDHHRGQPSLFIKNTTCGPDGSLLEKHDNHDGGDNENSRIRLGWFNGSDLLFDDTFTHGVVNPTASNRLVLFGDVVRYDCPMLLGGLLHFLCHTVIHRVSPIIQEIVKFSDDYAAACQRVEDNHKIATIKDDASTV